MYITKKGEQLDPQGVLSEYEKYLLEKLTSDPTQLPQKFKAWLVDYLQTNLSINVSAMPSLKGEEWREVGATGQPGFSNSWVNFDSTRKARFYKDVQGVVWLAGSLKSGTIGTAAFTLPAGYCPGYTSSGVPLDFAVESNGAHGRISIDSAGIVTPSAGSNVKIDLNGVVFRAA